MRVSSYLDSTRLIFTGILDTGVRMRLLIFLPFILKGEGVSLPETGMALARRGPFFLLLKHENAFYRVKKGDLF